MMHRKYVIYINIVSGLNITIAAAEMDCNMEDLVMVNVAAEIDLIHLDVPHRILDSKSL